MADRKPLLATKMVELPHPTFTYALEDERGQRLPQAIAHRGYNAAFPENTMGAFRGAIEVGAHAIETDIHVTRDGVVVLSHDTTLKRCFDKNEKIIDCDWDYLKTLHTVAKPQQSMPRLRDLLEYLLTPGLEDIWILLDVKLDTAADRIFKLISETIAEVVPSHQRPWKQRILVGCWTADQVSFAVQDLPEFPVTYIGWNLMYARKFLPVPGINFNMVQKLLVGPIGAKFMRDVKKAGRSLVVWTVNDEQWMRWCIRRDIDGVITDDPKKYLQVCKSYDGRRPRPALKQWAIVLFFNALLIPATLIFIIRHGFNVDTRKIRKNLEDARAK